ncbi:MAG: LLM class F420-dependent oxidoreductase [Actinomycetota bacterium]|nr:LLM class F420-dependent oxidoreductase [Actinomycetota bacterium]
MKLGVFMFPTDKAMSPPELAREVEARGFASLWFPEHSHIPASRRTPWGGPQRSDAPPLPEEYWRTHDQFVALGACAAVTERIELGTGICLVAQRDPIWLAKEVASVDVLSGGRLQLGIGYGWNVEEMGHHGVAFGERRAIVREKVLAMKELWTQDEASFSGEHVNFEPSWSYPKPIQQPHPPIILGGGGGPKMFDAVVEYADGWMPIGGRHEIDGQVEQLRRVAESKGRDPSTIDLGVFMVKPDPAEIERLAGLGITFGSFPLPPAGRDEVLPLLDRYMELLPAPVG